jgi:hypothetical protein
MTVTLRKRGTESGLSLRIIDIVSLAKIAA